MARGGSPVTPASSLIPGRGQALPLTKMAESARGGAGGGTHLRRSSVPGRAFPPRRLPAGACRCWGFLSFPLKESFTVPSPSWLFVLFPSPATALPSGYPFSACPRVLLERPVPSRRLAVGERSAEKKAKAGESWRMTGTRLHSWSAARGRLSARPHAGLGRRGGTWPWGGLRPVRRGEGAPA